MKHIRKFNDSINNYSTGKVDNKNLADYFQIIVDKYNDSELIDDVIVNIQDNSAHCYIDIPKTSNSKIIENGKRFKIENYKKQYELESERCCLVSEIISDIEIVFETAKFDELNTYFHLYVDSDYNGIRLEAKIVNNNYVEEEPNSI